MKRSLLTAVLLLVAGPAFAESLTVHLDLSDSVRAALARGDVSGIAISVDEGAANVTKEATTVIDGLRPGKSTLRVLLMTPKGNYVLEPDGLRVDIKPGAEVTLPVQSLFVTGTLSLHGKPLRGNINVWPSQVARGSWGFSAPADEEGKFAFPLPHAGEYDLDISWNNRGQSAKVPHFEFRGTEAHIDLPEGIIAGRVVDADGKGIAGAKVLAKLNASTPRPVAALAVADVDGDFKLDGLLDGTWTLTADGRPLLDIVLTDGRRKEGVLLRLGH